MKYIVYIILTLFYTNLLTAAYYEIKIPTRVEDADKKYLSADFHSKDTNTAKPVILIQTPYNKTPYRILDKLPANSKKFGFHYDTDNYHFVIVDWRGFYASKDASINQYDRGLDGYDIVEWIASQKWCNGKVGTCGGSALGMIQFQTARHRPPHLVCASPSIKDYMNQYSNYYYGGVFRKEHVESLEGLGFITASAILKMPEYNAVWERVADSTDYPEDFNVPMLMISGWFDHYPSDVIRAFHDIRERSDIKYRNSHKLIFGPWTHSTIGALEQGDLEFPDAEEVSTEATMRFFGYFLLGNKNNWEAEPVIRYFMMGDNKWETCEDWYSVKKENISLYLHPQGKLEFEPVPVTIKEVEPDTIVYNPKDPSPSVGGSRFNPFDTKVITGPVDIRQSVESRRDYTAYETAPLDKDIRVTGSIDIELFFASDRTDTDIAARLCDVYPDGRSIILTQGIQRLRYRNSLKKAELMEPGQMVQVKVTLEHLGHVFKAGHKLRIILTGSDYPMFDINLNNGGELYKPGDTLIARNLIYHDNSSRSRIVIPTDAPLSVDNTSQYKFSEMADITPNPTNETAVIHSGYITPGKGNICIFNSFGEILLQKNNIEFSDEGTIQIEVKDIPTGSYYIVIKNNSALIRGKLIIIR